MAEIPPAVPPVEEPATQYCLCQQVDSGIMIECIRGTGGCHGWVHPHCCGLVLTPEELEAIEAYVCPLCERPTDTSTTLKGALNTKMANKMALKKREKAEQGVSEVIGWKCKSCGQDETDRSVTECRSCGAPRKKSKKSQRKSIKEEDETEDAALRRRSGRESNKKRKNYHVPGSDEDEEIDRKKKKKKSKKKQEDGEDGEEEGDEEDMEHSTEPLLDVGGTMIIEKIMGVRWQEPVKTGIAEYYIKWKGFSYLHASWETKETLLSIDPLMNKQRIKRFHEKYGPPVEEEKELEYFNPEYLEIHRIIAHRDEEPIQDPSEPDMIDTGRRYLVKWRVLPYTEATWERACDLKDDQAIAHYEQNALSIPPKSQWDPLPRPSLREYRKLDTSPRFGQDQTLTLRPYQLEGLNWLLWNYYNERPSVLADEMGLGKTIQTLAFLDSLRTNPKIQCRGPFLVVAPLSLIAQWQSECETWTSMNCVVYHGNAEARDIIREFEFYYINGPTHGIRPLKFHILVTTYEVCIKDIAILSKMKWRCLVVDEAHRLKNQSSRLVEQMRSLRRDHCVLLTGTPLQNKTEELWALLNFLDPISFPSVTDFLNKFGDLHESQQVADLHKMLKPYLLRRVKEDVEKSLPPKEETIIEVELTPVQKQWYRAIYERNTTFLSRGGNPHNVPNLMNVMMELRKCCNHPYLNNGVEERLNQGLETEREKHDMMVKCCGKMVLLDKLLPRLKEGGHKVLIFSQMVRVLDLIEDYLRYMNYLHERLDGNIRGNDRQAAVDRFVKPEYQRFVMLLSTKAGGLGLNLTAADTVIIFDSDWNPQNDLQAQARAHRIGQTSSVKIYRLITRKTYEMHMFHKASLKLGLDKAVLTHMRRENEAEGSKQLKKKSKAQEAKEIDELLKRGAYDVFRDDDQAGEQFCAADIDQILQRSTQIVQYEQQAQSSFSKASFVSATTSDDVDIDDPDFWKKAVGLKEVEITEHSDIPLQRKRTRVSRFGTGGTTTFDSEEEDEEDKENGNNGTDEKNREPRDWTLNGRDRLQRALMHFGAGRWDIIRSQSGGSRSKEEIERFAREFIYTCGLASLMEGKEGDTPFVKGVLRAAQYAQEHGLIDEKELSSVLTDEEFMIKQKQGGGRRVLIRLDMLWRLQTLVRAACDVLDQEYNENEIPPPCNTAELDERVAYYGVDRVSAHLVVADAADRPSWTQITPWWSLDADRKLLMGVFLHGYGRCKEILADGRLRFGELALAAKDSNSVSTSGNDEDGQGMSEHSDVEDDSTVLNEEKNIPPAYKQPEVQQMNRLLFYLLSAEDLKRQKEMDLYKKERSSIEQSRQSTLERKQRMATLRRIELKAMSLAQMDILRHLCLLENTRQIPETMLNGHKLRQRDWTKEERRTFSYLLALYGAPRILAKSIQTADTTPYEDMPSFAWETDSLSWMNIVQWGQLNKTATMAQTYFEDKYLSKCREIAAMKVDPLGSDQRAMALADLIGIEFVDAHEGVLAHGLKARNTAWVSLRRMQLLDDILAVLTYKKPELYAYLRRGTSDLITDMPVWWCPWIHTLGVLYGMARYGIYGWEKILLDRTLPFHYSAREAHIRSVFPEPSNDPTWMETVQNVFPSFAILEQMVSRICVELLQDQMVDVEDRYEEPKSRMEYSFPSPGNAYEEYIMNIVRKKDRAVYHPFLELTVEVDSRDASIKEEEKTTATRSIELLVS